MMNYPFVVEHRLVPDTKNNRFLPESRLYLSPLLRTSGLLASLPDQDIRNLVWLLTYLTPNGNLVAPLTLLAQDTGMPARALRKQLGQLATRRWQGAPLIHFVQDEGAERYLMDRQLLGEESLELGLPLPSTTTQTTTGSRDAIIQMSRQKYGRPREEVEKIVLEQMGYHPEEHSDTEEGELRRGLRSLGVSRDQIEELIEEFGIEACLRQVRWLPLRSAKNPARYVVAAIQENYGPPRGAKGQMEPMEAELSIPEAETGGVDD